MMKNICIKSKKKYLNNSIAKKENKSKEKGFTLIELLAVIIILGVLMIIAIPSVTTYISNSRKSSYIDTAKNVISGARNVVNSGELGMYDTNTTYYIPASYIKTENGTKTPYGEFEDENAYVAVAYNGQGYSYYWISNDTSGQGVRNLTPLEELDESDIESDIKKDEVKEKIKTMGVGNRTEIKILNNDGEWSPIIYLDNTNNNISGDGSIENNSGNNAVETVVTFIFKNSSNNESIECNDCSVKVCTDSQCSNVVQTIKTGATISLNPGNYYILPVDAPVGYIKPTTSTAVSYNSGSNEWTITFEEGAQLPSTGGDFPIQINNGFTITANNNLNVVGKTVKVYKVASPNPSSASGWTIDIPYQGLSRKECIYSNCSNADREILVASFLNTVSNNNINNYVAAVFDNNNIATVSNLELGIYAIDLTSIDGSTVAFLPSRTYSG